MHRLNFSAKTAPKDVVFLACLSKLLLFKRFLNNIITNSDPSSVSIKFVFLLEDLRKFSKEFVMAWVFLTSIFQTISLKLSISSKLYLHLLCFQDRNPLNLKYLDSKYYHYDEHWFCWFYHFFWVLWKTIRLWKHHLIAESFSDSRIV